MPSPAAALASALGSARAKEAGLQERLSRAVAQARASAEREQEAARVADEQRFVIKRLSKQLDEAEVRG
jgi:hypothetical protein